jgi:hypothetical protein
MKPILFEKTGSGASGLKGIRLEALSLQAIRLEASGL